MYTETDIAEQVDLVTVPIRSLTNGLLEVIRTERFLRGPSRLDFAKVQFFHRTARDFLVQDDKRMEKLCQSMPNLGLGTAFQLLRLAEFLAGANTGGLIEFRLWEWLSAKMPCDDHDTTDGSLAAHAILLLPTAIQHLERQAKITFILQRANTYRGDLLRDGKYTLDFVD